LCTPRAGGRDSRDPVQINGVKNQTRKSGKKGFGQNGEKKGGLESVVEKNEEK